MGLFKSNSNSKTTKTTTTPRPLTAEDRRRHDEAVAERSSHTAWERGEK